jgi:uncharacterized protein (TIGR00251 family)
MIELEADGEDTLLPIKVVPNASRDRIVGELDGALKVSVAAAPEKGAANKAVCALIARQVGVRRQQVRVETGITSPRKVLRIAGVRPDQVRSILPRSP